VTNYKGGESIMETKSIKPIKEETTAKKKVISPKMIVIVAFLLIVVGVAGFVAYQYYQTAKMEAAKLEDAYQEAINAMEAGDYEIAASLFGELGDYKDSIDMIQECYDAQSLENLRALYQAIETIYQLDNELVHMVSTVIYNVDKINSVGTKLQTETSWAISSLYSGGSHRAYARCSAYDLASIAAYFPSAQVSEGRLFLMFIFPYLAQKLRKHLLLALSQLIP